MCGRGGPAVAVSPRRAPAEPFTTGLERMAIPPPPSWDPDPVVGIDPVAPPGTAGSGPGATGGESRSTPVAWDRPVRGRSREPAGDNASRSGVPASTRTGVEPVIGARAA